MKIDIASPCKRDWSKMSGDERSRFCGDCKMNVYNLSAMTQAEVQALVKEKEGRVCVKFYTRPDGTVLTRDCPVGVSRKRRTYAASMAAAASLLAFPFATAPEACESGDPGIVQTMRGLFRELKVRLGFSAPPMMMGEMVRVMPPTPAPAPAPALDTSVQ